MAVILYNIKITVYSDIVSHGNQGCQFGSVANAFKYVITRGGIDTEDTYPYVARVSMNDS